MLTDWYFPADLFKSFSLSNDLFVLKKNPRRQYIDRSIYDRRVRSDTSQKPKTVNTRDKLLEPTIVVDFLTISANRCERSSIGRYKVRLGKDDVDL